MGRAMSGTKTHVNAFPSDFLRQQAHDARVAPLVYGGMRLAISQGGG
jgi:hypothetical protein